MIKHAIFFTFLTGFVSSIYAQKIAGKITYQEGNPIPAAKIAMEYSNFYAYSDELVDFEIEIPAGIEKPALVIDHVGFSDIQVPLDKSVENYRLDVQLTYRKKRNSFTLKEY